VDEKSRENNLQQQKLTVVWVILPIVWVGMVASLILLSFISIKASSVISAENLILLTLLFSPIVYIIGAAFSIIAVVTSKMKKTAFLAAGLNIALLAWWLYFSKSFLMEFELLS
jgi:hypothetical protein